MYSKFIFSFPLILAFVTKYCAGGTTPLPENLLPCTYEGKTYQSYEFVYREYNENEKICDSYRCQNGSVKLSSSKSCVNSWNDRCRKEFRDGRCCPLPVCECEYEGVTYGNGFPILRKPFNDTNCFLKICKFGEIVDYYTPCTDFVAMLSPEDRSRCKLYYKEGQCCPVLDCHQCEFMGKMYHHDDLIIAPFDGLKCTAYWCEFGKLGDGQGNDLYCGSTTRSPSLKGCKEVFNEGECCPQYECGTDELGRRNICQTT